jgi:hypothetical protein
LTNTQVRADISFLQTQLVRRDAKYLRNMNRYLNNGQRRENIYELYNNPVSYFFSQSDSDTGPYPVENVIKSCIDTKVSKMSQVKVRPFFNPVNGKWKTRKVCRVGQQFFDDWYRRHSIYREAIEAYRDAQIFEAGYIWVDDETRIPRRVKPWEYHVDPAEMNYGEVSRMFLRFWKYPLLALKKKIKEGTSAWRSLERDIHAKADEVHVYYDLDGGVKYLYAGEELLEERKIGFDVEPVASIYCTPPVKGLWSTSIVDDLLTLQRELDVVNQKIHDATVLTPANLAFVPTMSGVKKSTIDAGREGLIYEYDPVPGASGPVEWMTPAPVNPQLLQRRKEIMETMYQISGVSQLSAQVKKPTGLNSGVALDTLEDVESERHNFELQNYELFCMKISEIGIAVFDPKETILPERMGRAGVTWKDIQEERDYYSIQFSPASALSNTPKAKMEEVEKLQKMGVIGPEMVASMLGWPDLEKSLGIASANRDDVEAITDRAAEKGEFDFYEAVNIQDLWRNVMNEIMRLDADEPENKKVMKNLVEFSVILKGKMDMLSAAAAPPQIPAPPPEAPPVALGQQGPPVPQGANPLAVPPGAPAGPPPGPPTPPPMPAELPPPPPMPPMPSEDPQLMQALAAIAQKVDAAAQVQPAPQPQPVNLTVYVDAKAGKTREVTQFVRDPATGEMVQSVKDVEPVDDAPIEEAPIAVGSV